MNDVMKVNVDEFAPCSEHGGAHMVRRVVGEMRGSFVSVTQEKGGNYGCVAKVNGRTHTTTAKSRDDAVAWLISVTE